jgi:hypothetical protein
MNTLLRRCIALALMLMMTACSTMQPVAQPRDFLEARSPSVIWLSKSSDPNLVALDGPKLMGDSIVGFIEGEYTEIALSQIKQIQAKQYSRSRTTAFLIGAGAVAVGLFFVIQGGHGATYDQNEEDDLGIVRFRR